MGIVALKDIRIADQSLDTLPLLNLLRQESLSAKAEVCIERARNITTFLRDMADVKESMEIRYARAVQQFLSNKLPLFFGENLLAGTTTSKPFGAPVYPELTGMTIWPELDTMSKREKNPQRISRSDADELNFNIFPYWMNRNIIEATRAREGNPACMKLFERIIFFIAGKAGTISHTVPCYKIALENGLEWLIEEAAKKEKDLRSDDNLFHETLQQLDFYRAVQIALKGVIAYAANLSAKASELAQQESDSWRKKNFEIISSVCAQVPAKPARNFREAVNSLWILQIAIHAESINMAISPGRLDQILFPWYRRDISSGSLTTKEAMELIGCLWLKLNDNTNLVPETSEELFGGAGTVPAVTIGGIDEDGEDAVNDLTYIMLRVTELLQTRDPSLNARYHLEKNSAAYRDRVAEVIASTKSIPAFYNDIAAIKTLENQGTATEDARDYAIIGCVELSASGRSYDASSSIMLNLVSALELAIYNGKRPVTADEQVGQITGSVESFKTFEEFWEAFETQLRWLIGEAVKLNEMMGITHQRYLPTPLLSALFEGPMEKGKDLIFGGARYNSSGATHIGFADTVDSLNAIEKGVFIDRKFTFPEIITALKKDFEGYSALHAYLVNRTPKYGTEDTTAVKNSQNLIRFLYETYQGYTNYRGGKYRPAYWTMTNHAGQGKLTGALPNGRKAYRIFASGITPGSQAATGLAACLNAVGGINVLHVPGGEAFNLKYSSIKDETDLQKFSRAIEAYFLSGGLHIQFNIMSYEMLIDAKTYPEKYPELLVRVSGYSAYFKDLNDAMKDEIITRTAYDLKSGKSVPFPEQQKRMLPSV